MAALPQSEYIKVIDYSYHNVQDIQLFHILTHVEYMEKLTTISISSFHLIGSTIIIPVRM